MPRDIHFVCEECQHAVYEGDDWYACANCSLRMCVECGFRCEDCGRDFCDGCGGLHTCSVCAPTEVD